MEPVKKKVISKCGTGKQDVDDEKGDHNFVTAIIINIIMLMTLKEKCINSLINN
jgi:hypothetical protein